jgi:hypothetical protein
MNLKIMPRRSTSEPIQQQLNQHLNHEQLCDLLLHDDLDVHALHGDALPATDAADHLAASQDHIRACLICSAELDLLRSSIAHFQALSESITVRESVRRPLNRPFSSLLPARSRGLSVPAYVWAAAALAVFALLPLSLLHLPANPLLNPPAISSQPSSNEASAPSTPEQDPVSDAALLDSINQDLSASVPNAMQPLDNPVSATEVVASQKSN